MVDSLNQIAPEKSKVFQINEACFFFKLTSNNLKIKWNSVS